MMSRNGNQVHWRFVVGLVVAMAAQPASASVIYTDVPDVSVSNLYAALIEIDLNGDSTLDYRLELYGTDSPPGQRFLFLYSLQSNSAVHCGNSIFVCKLPAGVLVGAPLVSPLEFGTGTKVAEVGSTEFPWGPPDISPSFPTQDPPSADGYFGFSFVIMGSTHYGWARMEVLTAMSPVKTIDFTLRDFAYENCPGEPLFTGKPTGGNPDPNCAGGGGSITVNIPGQVPEPATLLLVGSGVLSLILARRRRGPI